MSIFLIIIHVIVCIALIMIVLLQTGKGADMGAAFGGGSSQTLFGSSGASTFLSKATTVAAIVFMLTSLALAYMSGHHAGSSVMQSPKAPIEQPASQAVPEKGAQSASEDPQPVKTDQTEKSSQK
jgi:preprotein translocase subunit SecG